MTRKTSDAAIQKMTVTFPQQVLRRLSERVAPRQRSTFIVEAVEEKLALQEQLAAIEETAGSWTDEAHPEMKTAEAIDHWLTEFRRSWNELPADQGVQHGASQIPPG